MGNQWSTNYSDESWSGSYGKKSGSTPPPGAPSVERSVVFDGVDERIILPTGLTPTLGWTVEVWFKFSSGTGADSIIGGNDAGNTGIYWFIYFSGGTLFIEGGDGSAPGLSGSVTGADDGEWHQVVMTRGSGGVGVFNAYLDAVNFVSDDNSLNTAITADETAVGAFERNDTSTAEHWFNGSIAHVVFWSSELSSSEITAIYNSGNPIDPTSNSGDYVSSANVIAFYQFHEDDDVTGTAGGVIDQATTKHATGSNLEAGDLDEDYPS